MTTNYTRGNHGLADCNHAPLRSLFNITVSDAGITTDIDPKDIEIQTTFKYVIDGQFGSRNAATGINVLMAGSEDGSVLQAAGTTCYYVIAINAAGNFSAYKQTDDVAEYPGIPDGMAPVAVAKVVNTTNAFTIGVTDYNAAGVTTTWTNVSQIPSAVV